MPSFLGVLGVGVLAASSAAFLMCPKRLDLPYFSPSPVAMSHLPSGASAAKSVLWLRCALLLRKISAVHAPFVENLCGKRLLFFGISYKNRLSEKWLSRNEGNFPHFPKACFTKWLTSSIKPTLFCHFRCRRDLFVAHMPTFLSVLRASVCKCSIKLIIF